MKLLLHSNQLGLGGSEIALWDYACGCEDILGHDVLIAANRIDSNDVFDRFSSRFRVVIYPSPDHLHHVAEREGIEVAYFIADGRREGSITIPGVKNVIHAVFPFFEPYGDVYAYVSEWLARTVSQGKMPWVPHIVDPLPECGNLRSKLGIPEDAIVFGGYGRKGQFDIPFVHHAVREVANFCPNIYFVFMNFDPFTPPQRNIIFLPGSSDKKRKSELIGTCDAMLHASPTGETFGLAIAEFSSRNKPVLTFGNAKDKAHIAILGDKAIYYHDYNSLALALCTFRRRERDWNAYREFTPEKVMKKFDAVFLKGTK